MIPRPTGGTITRPTSPNRTWSTGGTATRPTTPNNGSNPARPTTGTWNAGGTITRPTTTPGASARYRPTQPSTTSRPAPSPSAPTNAPIARDPAPATKPALTPRPARPDAPVAADRYKPGTVATKPLVADRPAPRPTNQPLAPTNAGARRPTGQRPLDVVATQPPRLTSRRPSTAIATTPTAFGAAHRPLSSAVAYRPNYYDPCHRSVWCDYWDPWACGYGIGYGYGYAAWNPWCGSPGWSFGWYGGAFSWRVSLWYPFWYCRTSYWYGCYGDAFWCGWSRPYYPASCYSWYPSTVYCPTYLYVPNTVYVPSTVYVTNTTVTAPTEDAAGATSTVIAAGAPSDRVIVREEGAGSESRAQSLAQKYVELGDFYFRDHRFRDAAEAYGKARSHAPNDATVHLVLADAVFADGDYHYAAFLIGEAVRLDPAIVSAAADKREAYGDVKVFYAQMQALDAYLAKASYDAQAHFVKGYNLHFSARRDDAKKAFQRVLEIEPGHRGAEAFLTAVEPAAAPVVAPASEASEIR